MTRINLRAPIFILVLILLNFLMSCGSKGPIEPSGPGNGHYANYKQAGSINTLCAEDMALYNDSLYIADGPGGLLVYDISTINAPVLVEQIPINYAFRTYVFRDHLVMCCGPDGIKIFNLATPSSPIQIFEDDTDWATSAVVHGDYLYVGDFFGGFRIYNFKDPENSSLSKIVNHSRVRDITFEGNTLLVSDAPYGLATYFMKSPLEPQGTFTYNNGLVLGNHDSVVGYGGYAITSRNDDNSRIDIFNISNLLQVELKNTIYPTRFIEDLSGTDGHLFVACGEDGFSVYDIRKLPNLPRVASFETPGYTLRVKSVNDLLLVADMNQVLIFKGGGQ